MVAKKKSSKKNISLKLAKANPQAKRKAKALARPAREYNNDSRTQKSLASRKAIIETLVHLLVERKGGEVTLEEVSKAAKISLRTIYRFFEDKKSLYEAMDEYLIYFLNTGNEQLGTMKVGEFGRNAFRLFDKHENLMLAYLYSPFGQDVRRVFRKKLNQTMIEKMIQENNLSLGTELKKKLALVASLVNAKIWHDIKVDYGYSGEQMGSAVEWALETLLKDLGN